MPRLSGNCSADRRLTIHPCQSFGNFKKTIRFGDEMSTLMWVLSVWAMAALLVVLFVHGASVKSKPPGKRKPADAKAPANSAENLRRVSYEN